jgi:hypothetical protein
MKLRKISCQDVYSAFLGEEEREVLAHFADLWEWQLGKYFELPELEQLARWAKQAQWDGDLLLSAVINLKDRAKPSATNPLDPQRRQDHARKYFTAQLKYKVSEKYPREDAA